MPVVVPVRFSFAARDLWFDPRDVDILEADHAVCSTERGTEIGLVTADPFEVDERDLSAPLKPVLRRATDADLDRADELADKGDAAMADFRRLIKKNGLDMKPVGVEFLFGGEKAIFYFAAEDRVDFRQLVKDLSSFFHMRVDMRQIGVRDEARMVGGLGHCGQELCCKRLGGEFCPVSIRMAKEQDLSLNPQKISGVCGRLMCCLRYEFDAYKDFKSRAPKKNASIQTPEGPAKVVDLNVPREIVSLKTEEGQVVKVPLADFEPTADAARPTQVGQQAWEEATAPVDLVTSSSLFADTHSLSGKDKLAEPGAVRHTGSGSSNAKKRSGSNGAQQKAADTRKPRRRSKVSTGTDASSSSSQQGKKKSQSQAGSKQGNQAKQGAKQGSQAKQGNGQKQKRRSASEARGGESKSPQKQQRQQTARPGRKSSALRQHAQQSAADRPFRQGQGGQQRSAGEGSGRRSRRRSHTAHGHDEASGANNE